MSEDSNTPSLLTPPAESKSEVNTSELSVENVNVSAQTKEKSTEESLTPPLLPSMKVKSNVEPQSDKKVPDKEIKAKTNQWDMFAEQDIFKADTSVRITFFFNIFYLCTSLFTYCFGI